MTTIVSIGQAWLDNDTRAQGRKIRVLSISDGYATCEIIADRAEPVPVRGKWNYTRPAGFTPVGRTTKIRVDRFKPTSTGYRCESAQ